MLRVIVLLSLGADQTGNWAFFNLVLFCFSIQYDPTFGNAFWNSSTEGFALYLFLLLTNWALVCDVWYLPRMTRLVGFFNTAHLFAVM